MAYTNEPGSYRGEPDISRREEGAYSTPPLRASNMAVTDYHDLVRWGPIFAGLVMAIATQLVLSGVGAAIGLTSLANMAAPQTNASEVGAAVGIWSIISLLIALFFGGWVMARACGPMNRNVAMLNGAILWATTLAVSAWLLSSGVAGAFGLAAQGADAIVNQLPPSGLPETVPNTNVAPPQVQDFAGNAAAVGWSFTLGSLLGLVAALWGSVVGARTPRVYETAVR